MPACRIRYHTAPATDCWLTGSASMGAAQVRDDHLAGKDRDNNRHERTPGGLPASLPGRMTDGLERGQNLAKAGLIVGGAHGVVPLVGGEVHLHDLVRGPPPQGWCLAPMLTIEVTC